MSLLIFSGLLVATALLALNTFDNLKALLKPVPVRVRSRNDR
ncbi:hypothetical protein [Hymenobacter metallicola]|nr:hypothetical protein [Hymenobacter metallicola]